MPAIPSTSNNFVLYQFGLVQWRVWPFNVHELTHTTASDYARKEIAGAPIFREWVGEGDEEITMRGKLFPRHFTATPANLGNGTGDLEALDNMRRFAQANLLMRGDGVRLGWYVIERLSRGHTLLRIDGVGQQIEFEVTFQRVPVPEGGTFYRDTTMVMR